MLFSCPTGLQEELEVVASIDQIHGLLQHRVAARPRWGGLLIRQAFARAIQGSNTIEGYTMSLDDALDVVEGEEPLEAEQETWAAVSGYRVAMTYVMQLADDPHFVYHELLLRSLHYMMTSYDLAKAPGKWRPGFVAVRREDTGEIVYEGPDAGLVPDLVGELVEWLNEADADLPGLLRGAMAHLNLVMIHPFRDGNGRMARGLQTLVLARAGILAPEFSSIEEFLGRNTPDYYEVLAAVGQGAWNPDRDARPWLRFCLKAHFIQAGTVLRRVREGERVWEQLRTETENLNLPGRVLTALFDAAMGFRVRNATYRAHDDLSEAVAGRDLKMLVDAGLLVPAGEKRGRSYRASDRLRSIREASREPRLPATDPFAK